MLGRHPIEPEARQPPRSRSHDRAADKIWTEAIQVHALAREVSAHTAAHDAFGLPGLPGLSASSRRAAGGMTGSDRLLLSPVAEEEALREEGGAEIDDEPISLQLYLET